MTILREIKDPEIKTTYQYVLDLRDRLYSTCELPLQTLEESFNRFKKKYVKKNKNRCLKEERTYLFTANR